MYVILLNFLINLKLFCKFLSKVLGLLKIRLIVGFRNDCSYWYMYILYLKLDLL